MDQVPPHTPSHLRELVQEMIIFHERTTVEIEEMIQQYVHLEKRINGIKIKGRFTK